MNRPTPALLTATALVVGIWAQTPSFEVASVRPASPPNSDAIRSGGFHRGATIDAGHLDFGYVSLGDLLPYAFRVKQYQVTAPSWTKDSRWNILANLPAGSQDQAPEMMQTLLADRFKLAVHHEKHEQSVYLLSVAAGGPKVEVSTGGEFKLWDGSFPGFSFGRGVLGGGAVISGRITSQPNCDQRWEFVPLSMNAFSDALTMFVGKPVVDQTGLKGDYQVTLDINPETMMAMDQNLAAANGVPPPGPGGGGGGGRRGPDGGDGAPRPAPGPAQGIAQCMQAAEGSSGSLTMLFKAVQKLGLTLQQGRAPIDMVVVDHLEKSATEN